MAKLFYTAAEAAEKLGTDENGVKDLVKEGKLREFRDAGSVNYKVGDVDKVAAEKVKGMSPVAGEATAKPKPSDSGIADRGGSSAAEIILEPAEGDMTEDSSIELAAGSDILSLEDEDSGSGGTSALTAIGGAPKKKGKGDTAVPSVGVNVFDDDDLDEHVDPLAQTAVTDVAGLGLEGLGAGSGIMDLTRESDDTSLGRELLDEIYTDEAKDSPSGDAEDTKAGLEVETVPDTADEDELAVAAPARASGRAAALETADTGADPVTLSLTAMMAVAVVVMWFAGLGAAALVRGITPTILQWLYEKLMFAAIGAVVAGLAAAGVTYLLSKRSADKQA